MSSHKSGEQEISFDPFYLGSGAPVVKALVETWIENSWAITWNPDNSAVTVYEMPKVATAVFNLHSGEALLSKNDNWWIEDMDPEIQRYLVSVVNALTYTS